MREPDLPLYVDTACFTQPVLEECSAIQEAVEEREIGCGEEAVDVPGPVVDVIVYRIFRPRRVRLHQPARTVHIDVELQRMHELVRLRHLQRTAADRLSTRDIFIVAREAVEIVLDYNERRRRAVRHR